VRLVVFGATGKTGQHVCRKALDEGHAVTAFGRSVAEPGGETRELHAFRGDVFDAGAVAEAIVGQDAAIVCLGSTSLRDKKTLSAGTKNIVDAMVARDVSRLVVTSAAGVGESWGQVSWSVRLLFWTMPRNVLAGHRAQEAIVKGSNLDWTVVRAAVLTDRAGTGNYTKSNTAAMSRISRADLADCLVSQLADPTHSRQAISVTS